NPPVITAQPVGVITNVGVPIQLSVSASGLGPFAYQWVQNQTNNVGLNSFLLSIPAATRTNNGSYYVAVSNGGGATISSNAIVKDIGPQKVTTPTTLGHTVLFLIGDSDDGVLTTNVLSAFTAQASSNLINWISLPNAL